MKIDRVLHVRGSRMDFYSFDYFYSIWQTFDLTDGKYYGYGKDLSAYDKKYGGPDAEPTEPVVVDYSACAHFWDPDEEPPLVTNPYVPPCDVITEEGVSVHDTEYMDYWLGYYNGKTPEIVDPTKNIYTTINDTTIEFPNYRGTITIVEPSVPYTEESPLAMFTSDGTRYFKYDSATDDYYVEMTLADLSNYFDKVDTTSTELAGEYRVKDVVQVYKRIEDTESFSFDFSRHVVDVAYTMPIVNGFCCFPGTSLGKLKATDSHQYLQAPSDRDRGIILVDFTQVGGCTFLSLNVSSLEGDLNEFLLPSTVMDVYDETTQSMLIVIDGRLLKPSQYTKVGNHISVKTDLTTLVSELDRKVCAGEHIAANSRMVESTGTRDRLRQSNSFVILVNTPNLQVVEHWPWLAGKESTLEHGCNSYAALDSNQFSAAARGLLFNNTDRSIINYSREEHTSTFYAENTQQEVNYKTSTVLTKAERPLVILAGSLDNLMSAKAVLFDNPNNFVHDDQIMWPRWVILDLIFRG